MSTDQAATQRHIMFDVDGTLVQSFEFDELCFIAAVLDVTGIEIDRNWSSYPHVTDWGLLATFCEQQATAEKFDEWYPAIKRNFIERINDHLNQQAALPVPGALHFFDWLRSENGINLSIATGGWGETARQKLESAGFNLFGIPLVSSNDHFSRIEIMRKAATGSPTTYFGDAVWDKRACQELDFRFIGVGHRVQHSLHIPDFQDLGQVIRLL